ncbi:N-acetylmuramoyl-L-alanine amidase [Clostridium cavendishii DSM 21758]|uniref:N-acetylmuramoyl-L-alanine amidase n=1 Tax=Clostridium cavendishii DSM 21758 TaxID=1121302 RepID=A0A1M6CVX9_9CLOT|nr:N-acetylmuramoyl-L-alanine amidase [Clostridium cavendishii]SHI65146.1 N-acetylmuramoyl-L-alanine amidase [Clostridium cavendishii DSM 21758]
MYVANGSTISGDAGHNCYPDSGAVGIRVEDNCTRDVWKAIEAKLKDLGYGVVDCTPWGESFNTVGESLSYRVRQANNSDSSLHLCIHFNVGGGKGVECWISDYGGRAEKFASQICDEISNLGYYNRGVKVGNLYVPKYTNMSCVLVECSFLDSSEDMNRYNVNDFANAIIKAITGNSSGATGGGDSSGSGDNSGNVDNNYSPNAIVRYDWLYTRDANGNIEEGHRVDIGDKIEVLDVGYTKQLDYIIYPTPWGVRRAYVTNGEWIGYLNENNGKMNVDADGYDSPNGSVIGSIYAGELVTTLQESGDWVNIVYSTNKGNNTKSAWVRKSQVKY